MYRMNKNLEQKIQKQNNCNRKHLRKKEMYRMKESWTENTKKNCIRKRKKHLRKKNRKRDEDDR